MSERRGLRRAIVLPVGVVVVTHGQLAAELVNAAEAIVGDLAQHRRRLDWLARRRGAGARGDRRRPSSGWRRRRGTLVLTDMFGGTPSNLAVTFLGRTAWKW